MTTEMDSRLTFSEINETACMRRHQFAYVLGIRPRVTATALRIGSAIHLALECRAHGGTVEDATECAVAGYDAPGDALAREVIRILVHAYYWRYGADTFVYEAVEESFDVPIVNPETGRASRTFTVAGRRDARIACVDERRAVMEHKTAGVHIGPDADYWLRLRIDLQPSIYLMTARQEGHRADYVLYDVIRKPTIAPKLLTQADTKQLHMTSSYFGLPCRIEFNSIGEIEFVNGEPMPEIKQGTNGYAIRETVGMFGARLWRDIQERPDYYFARREITRLESDIAEAQADLWQYASLIREASRLNHWPRRTSQCVGFGRCPYFSLCTSGFTGADLSRLPPEFEIVQNVHQELEQEGE